MFKSLKDQAGSHSPSIATIKRILPNLNIKVDACFLSNPYATELFMSNFKKEILDRNKLSEMLEYYPSQNDSIAKFLAQAISVPSENLIIGNGAIEIIEELLNTYLKGSVAVPIPTFSPYYEILERDRVEFIQLKKEDDYQLNIENLITELNSRKIDNLILINPNNPTGHKILNRDIDKILELCPGLKHLIIDESFIHFDDFGDVPSTYYSNSIDLTRVSIVKSLSKDFGIAGIRAGYGILSSDVVTDMLNRRFLWNSNGIAEYFFTLYSNSLFNEQYLLARKNYLNVLKEFRKKLNEINGLRVIDSSANFYLVEILNNLSADDIVENMLFNYGVYVRTCSDKIGLEGEYLRIACRTSVENDLIIESLTKALMP